MVFKKLKIDTLIPAKYNPRKKLKPGDPEFEKIKNSITEFGYVDPIIVNSDMTIIGGHQRWSVLKALGYTEIDCVVIEIDKTKEKALNIALNKVTGDWNKTMLAELIKDLQSLDYNVAFTGFESAEIEDLFASNNKVKEDDFDLDAEQGKPVFSKPGDIWHLGRHSVICGDSTLKSTYDMLLGNKKVNLVCTDAPYLVKLQSSSGTIRNDDLDDKKGYEFLFNAFSCFHDAMAKDASIYEFYATSKARVFHDAFEDAGFKVGAGIVWKKDRLVLTRTDWKYIHEPIIFGWRKDGKHIWYGDQKQVSVFQFDRIKNSKEDGCGHPSSKPIPLIAYLIELSTKTNDLVLDGFLGSASTLIACEQLNRTCYGVEIEPKFVDIAVNRYINFVNSTDEVTVQRDGLTYKYEEIVNGNVQ